MEEMVKDTCLYIHTRKSDGRIFYVGIGDKYRPYEKISRNRYWHNIVNKYNYDVKILAEGLTWEEACNIEIKMIAFYGRIKPNPKTLNYGCLVNMTDGGEGSKGMIVSEETRKKKSEVMKGKTHTEETRKKLSSHHKINGTKPPSQKGYKHTEEARKKITESLKGKTHTEEARKNMSLAQKGHKVSYQARKNMSEAQKAIGNKPPAQWGKKHNSKIVLDVNTGVFYDNGAEVADLYSFNRMTFSNWLNGKRPNKTSFRYV